MKQQSEKTIPYNPAVLAIVTAAVILLLYVLFMYPLYTKIKMEDVKDAYREITDMNLSALDEEDTEVFQAYAAESMEFLITNEKYAPVYISRVYHVEEQIDKYIESHLEQFQEKPDIVVRSRQGLRVIRLRALVTQNGQNYYVYIRREIRLAGEIIYLSAAYFLLAGALAVLAWYLVMRRKKLYLSFAGQKYSEKILEQRQRINEAQKEFVANISHELKTPLAVISGQVEMLQSMGDGIDRSYYFASIREEIEKMSDLVGNLLDITIVDHTMEEMELSEVNLSDMMDYMAIKYDAMFRKNQIKVSVQVARDCVARANRMYLEQAVNNYIMNAFQHTAQGKSICILLEREEKLARIGVYNEGAQIPEEDMDRIWQSFYKSSRSSREKNPKLSNAGLGLFMVKKIVEQHGGTCGVENKDNGVEFWIRIPLMK